MYLTYMLGCSADQQEQQELQACTSWLNDKKQKESNYETTKLEWAKTLGTGELSVLDDPLKNYGQMGAGDLPAGAKVVSLDEFLKAMREGYLKKDKSMPAYQTQELARMEDRYQPTKGAIIKFDDKSVGSRFIPTHYAWYPAREAPVEEVKGLTRLKGHLQQGQWLTKFRKILRKDEMTHDLVLAEVPQNQQQTYVRIMPTSPP
jgi:hypothetical protein